MNRSWIILFGLGLVGGAIAARVILHSGGAIGSYVPRFSTATVTTDGVSESVDAELMGSDSLDWRVRAADHVVRSGVNWWRSRAMDAIDPIMREL